MVRKQKTVAAAIRAVSRRVGKRPTGYCRPEFLDAIERVIGDIAKTPKMKADLLALIASERKRVPVVKRAWFVRDGGVDDEEGGFKALCKKRGWTPIETWCSWNENEGAIGLAVDRNHRYFLVGSEPYIQEMTLAETMEFNACMFHESQEGGDYEGQPVWYRAIKSELERSAL